MKIKLIPNEKNEYILSKNELIYVITQSFKGGEESVRRLINPPFEFTVDGELNEFINWYINQQNGL